MVLPLLLTSLGLGTALGGGAAQPGDGAAGGDWGGRVESNLRLGLVGCGDAGAPGDCAFRDFKDTVVLGLWTVQEPLPGDPLRAEAALDVRLSPRSRVEELDDLGEMGVVQPVSLRLDRAFLAWGRGGLLLEAGVLRHAWGTGLGISVADELQPYDLEDPTRFDQRLPTANLSATLTRGDWSLQGVVLPLFAPAVLPVRLLDLTAGADDLFDAESTGAGDVTLDEVELRPGLPEPSLAEVGAGVRLRWTPPALDLGLSWVHGRDSLPQVDGEVILTGFQTDTDRVSVGVPLTFPRRDVGALELRGTPWGELGAWGELAVVLPERTVAQTSRRQLEALERIGTISEVPDPLPATVTQDGAPYLRWLVGLDRSLGQVLVAVQWLHGFPTERQAADVADYGLLSARWTPLPALRLDLSGTTDGLGALGSAEVGWLHRDLLELYLGGTQVVAPPESSLHGFRGVSHLRTGARLVF